MHFDEEEHFLGGEVIKDPAVIVQHGYDVRAWASVTHAGAETEALLALLHTLEVQHAEWQRRIKTGLRPHQDEIADLDAKTRLFRAFEPTFIPGLLQTAEYARARFAQSITADSPAADSALHART